MSTSNRFWDRIAERYSRRPVPDEAVYREKLQITRQHLRPDMSVLEFGCGSGTTAISHAPFVRHIHGIDSSAKMIEIANSKAATAGVANASFEQVSIERYAAANESLDAILALSVLHLLPEWTAAIDKVHRMLKPGGVFVSSTPCLGRKSSLLRMLVSAGYRLGLIPQVRFFAPEDLLEALTTAGFAVERDWRPGNGSVAFVVASKRS